MIMLLVPVTMTAQQKTDAMLFGDVRVKGNGDHIPYASVVVKGTQQGTMADHTGHFKLPHLPVGEVVVVARATGYKPAEFRVTMEAGKAVTVFFELETDVVLLTQMVVTGTRSEHTVRDVPVKTELITQREIQARNAGNLFEALECVPGVRVENQCQSCNFTMVRMQGLGAEHTQVLINGQPIYSGLAGVYGLQQLSTVDVSRIEVVKGAGSALYGSSAVAGAINIITREPNFAPGTTLDMQFGNHKSHRFDISSTLRNEKGNIGLILFARRTSEGIIDQTGAGMTRAEVMQTDGVADRVATSLFNAGFGLYINDLIIKNDRLVIRGKNILEQRDGGIITNDQYKNPYTEGTESILTDRYETELSYQARLRHSFNLEFSMAYINHRRKATNDSFLGDYLAMHGDTAPDVRDMRPYLAGEHTLTSTLTISRKFGKHQIITGIQGYNSRLEESGMYVVVDENSPFAGLAYRSVGKKRGNEIGLFVQDEWMVTPRLMVVPGVRIDRHTSGERYEADQQVSLNDNFPETSFGETSVNPRMAVKYEISKHLTLRANAGTGYRAPYGFSEDLHLCSGSPRVWKSSELLPETSLSFNLSLDYYHRSTTAGINLFRTNLKNKIGFTGASEEVAALGYDYEWQNIDNAHVQGIELAIKTALTKRFTLGVDLVFNQGLYDQEREDWAETPYAAMSRYISRFPATTGNIYLDYQRKTWNVLITGSYQGTMYIDYFNEEIDPELGDQSKIKQTDPVFLLNASASKSFGKWRVYGGVKNMLNTIQDERHLDDAAFIYAPLYGRMIYAGVRIEISR